MNDLLLSREDLETILMCFKEKNQALRLLAYECLSNVTLISPSDLLPLVDRLHQALQVYKADKKKIYRLLHQLGVKYSDYISDNFSKLYSYSEEE